ncbi:MAG: alpha/beta hydrolase [Anaerolineales bacterium]
MTKINIAEQDIYYTEKGSGPAMLIFPDNLHSSEAYAKELDHFSGQFHVLSYDYPGKGKSTRDVKYLDEQEYNLWNYWADFACHLLMELGIEECCVIGSGFGSLAALHFAGKQFAQHRITPTCVIADSFLSDLKPRTLHRALDVREHFYVRNAKSLEKQHGDDWRDVVDADTVLLRKLADRGGYKVHDFVLNAIPCPVLLTGSLQDVLTPGIAQDFARLSGLIPDCSLHLTSTADHPYGEEHPLMWTDRESFRAVCDMFLSNKLSFKKS